jgi:hypothetical protein
MTPKERLHLLVDQLPPEREQTARGISASPPEVLRRGVYLPPWLGSRGQRCVVAINSQGRRILEATVCPGVDEAAIAEMVWRVLDAEDPDPPPRPLLTVA